MVNRLKLTHLTFTGTDRPNVSVDFSDGTTVIHGPSDTGKSFVAEALDFMLGAESLRGIPQLNGYSQVLLGLVLADGQHVTLRRNVTGGRISLFRTRRLDSLGGMPDRTFAWKHHKTAENVSTFLLQEISLEGRRIRKNVHNATVEMSFRFVAHLCIVGEEKIQSARSSLVSSPMSPTADISAFKVILQGEDDSALVEVLAPEEINKARNLRHEVIDQLISEVDAELSTIQVAEEPLEVLARLNESLRDDSSAVDSLIQQREAISSRIVATRQRNRDIQLNLDESVALHARFALLRSQYDSDLERLELLHEADGILDYFNAAECPLCGASRDHRTHAQSADGADFRQTVSIEEHKTRRLRADLDATMNGVERQRGKLHGMLIESEALARSLAEEVSELSRRLRPAKVDIKESLSLRSQVERSLALEAQIRSLKSRKASYSDEAVIERPATPVGLSSHSLDELSKRIVQRLVAWGVPNASTALFSPKTNDVVIENQPRGTHGKGIRSLLHAAFTISLAQYCFDTSAPHPGFVVLDSPLVAYRPPDKKNPDGPSAEAEGLSPDVVEAFYRDIESNFDGQIIILENTSPKDFLSPGSGDIQFAKSDNGTRYGLFPR